MGQFSIDKKIISTRSIVLAVAVAVAPGLYSLSAQALNQFKYSEGQCLNIETGRAVQPDVCGFQLGQPDRIEWDLVGRKCQKILVFVSKVDTAWEHRLILSKEKHSLADCGYDLKNPQQEYVYRESSRACYRELVFSSHKGLQDHRETAISSSPLNHCGILPQKQMRTVASVPKDRASSRRPSGKKNSQALKKSLLKKNIAHTR